MTVGDLILLLEQQDPKKRVVVSDTDGAGRHAAEVEFVDQRSEHGESVVTIWIHV